MATGTNFSNAFFQERDREHAIFHAYANQFSRITTYISELDAIL